MNDFQQECFERQKKYSICKYYLEELPEFKRYLTDEHMVELYEEILHDTFIETLRMALEARMTHIRFSQIDFQQNGYWRERDELFSIYEKCRKLADQVKSELKLKAMKVSSEQHSRTTSNVNIPMATVPPTCAAKDPDCAKPPGKSMNKFYKKRAAFHAQLRSIVTFESCPKMSRSERILHLIGEFETASATARMIAGEDGDEDNSLLGDGLLVSLAMSKLDEETLAQLAQQQDPSIIPTWAMFREELLHLTKNSE